MELFKDVHVDVTLGVRLNLPPQWDLTNGFLIAGPYNSAESHGHHFDTTVGSGDWNLPEFDEFRFDWDSRELLSFWFHIPESSFFTSGILQDWLEKPSTQGNLRLSNVRNFEGKRTDLRWFDPQGKYLAGLLVDVMDKQGQDFRLRVTDDLDLLFAGERYYGWLLSNPARWLANDWASPSEVPVNDPELNRLLYEFMQITERRNLTKLLHKDQDLQSSIYGLLDQVQSRHDSLQSAAFQWEVLRQSVEELVDRFYEG